MCQVVISTVKTQIFFSIYAPVLFVIIFLVSMYQRSLSTAPENYVIPQTSAIPNMESFQRLYFFPKTTNLWKFRKILSNFCTVQHYSEILGVDEHHTCLIEASGRIHVKQLLTLGSNT